MDLYVQNLTNQNVSYLNIIEKIWCDPYKDIKYKYSVDPNLQ